MGITKCWGKAAVVAGCLSVMAGAAHAGYDSNVGAATDSKSTNSTSTNSATETTTSSSTMSTGSSTGSMQMSRSEIRMHNAQMLIQTLSEEKTEIHALKVQRMALMHMGGLQNKRLARTFGRWEAEHEAAGPTLMRLIRMNGGDPMGAQILKPPVLGSTAAILMAQHKDHEAAVMSSQMRFNMTDSEAIKMAMHKRAILARKHLSQMMPFHAMMMDASMKMGSSSSTTTTTQTTTTTVPSAPDSTVNSDATTTTTTTDNSSTNATMDNSASGATSNGATSNGATSNGATSSGSDSTMTQ